MKTRPMKKRKTRSRLAGFTLLEVLIAMSILAVGATSVLGIFVAALKFHTDRVEDNRITGLLNHAKTHAEIAFNNHVPDPDKEDGSGMLPPTIEADFTDQEAAQRHPDPMVRDAAERFKNFRYVVEFEDSDITVPGSSVVVTIKIYGLDQRLDESIPFDKLVLTRDGTPVNEFFRSPSITRRDEEQDAQSRGAGRPGARR